MISIEQTEEVRCVACGGRVETWGRVTTDGGACCLGCQTHPEPGDDDPSGRQV